MSTNGEKHAEAPEDLSRRELIVRISSALMVAGAAGLGTYAVYDGTIPIRVHRVKDREMPDHRVKVSSTTPYLVIARGPDPAKNARAALSRMGGMKTFVGKGDFVVIKPNAGWDRSPEQAANTNPELMAALVRECRSAGADKVIVTDCSVNDAERSFVNSGISDAVRGAGGTVVFPSKSRYVEVRLPGKLGRWPVLEPFVLATKLINVPIAKHHSLTRVTLGMKNWYGVLGGQRRRLHQRVDDSIAELASFIRPTLTVMDATRVLMRNGPTGGSLADVKREDALAVSLDPVAADAWGALLLGA
ncbi:MAG: DUF362 domain-containing protein, partial [Pseudomonadota bacterium]